MLAYHHIATAANPELRSYLERANQERAAAVYAAWTAVTGAISDLVGPIAESIRHARRAHQTYRALSGLSDHQLKDIGLSRGEVAGVSETIADEAGGNGLTISQVRRAEYRNAVAAAADNRPRRSRAVTAWRNATLAHGHRATA